MSQFQILTDTAADGRPLRNACAVCGVQGSTICSVFESPEFDSLVSDTARIKLAAGQTFVLEGDEARHVFIVISGLMRLHKLLPDGRRQITRFLFDSDFHGLVLQDLYTDSAEAIVGTTVCRWPRAKLKRLCGEYPKLEKRLLCEASNELNAAQEQMLLLGRKSAAERLASFLRTLMRRQAGPAVPLLMSRTDIADYLGLTVETVSRTFTKLRRSGVIETPDAHTAVMKDPGALERIAEGSLG